ncbi:FecR domain-containing protein [Imbroritus primus]|uniref:FecR domain-containing protein n=1 Tax=Imbroritus primus TaxID=3058603 RepID=UPI003D16154D
MKRLRALLGLGCAAGSLLCSPVLAQPAGSRHQDFLYQVQDGDTIFDIASRYATAKDWAQLVRLNKIDDPRRLVPGTTVRVPLRLIEKDPTAARVLYQKGEVQIVKRDMPVSGALLERGTEIHTGPDGYLSLELLDGSTVLVLPNARMRIEQVTEFRRAGLQDFVILLERGQVEPNVDPSGKGVGRFEIRTPRAVTGVRGTRFRVGVTDDSVTGEVLKGEVEVLARGARDRITIREGQGLGATDRGVVNEALLPAPRAQAEVEPGFGDVVLRYAAIPEAVAYRVQLARDKGFTQVLESRATAQLEHTFADLDDGDYYIKVRAISAAGIEGNDTVEHIQVAARPAPPLTIGGGRVAGSELRQNTVAWAAVPGSAGYELEWWPPAPPGTPHMQVPLAPDVTSFTLPGEGAMWRIRTVVERDGQRIAGPWSTVGKGAGAVRDAVPVSLHWRPRAGMAGQLEISAASGSEGAPRLLAGAADGVALPPLPAGDYAVRQRYIDRHDVPRAYTPPQRLRIGPM